MENRIGCDEDRKIVRIRSIENVSKGRSTQPFTDNESVLPTNRKEAEGGELVGKKKKGELPLLT
jgi:hypothetical protein